MTIAKFFLFSLFQAIILTFFKAWFFSGQPSNFSFWQTFGYCFLVAVFVIAVVRRFGILNYLESFFLVATWTAGGLLLDLLITSAFTGYYIFAQAVYWYGFLALALGIIVFHKKRHVYVRKQQAKHGHH